MSSDSLTQTCTKRGKCVAAYYCKELGRMVCYRWDDSVPAKSTKRKRKSK